MQSNLPDIIPDLKNRNILLVEDDMFSNLFMQNLLRRTGACPLAAFSGSEGLEIFFKNPIHLAFLDLRLPDMDGFAMAKIMRAHDFIHPIIAISGRNDIPEAEYQHSDFDYHFEKPLRMKTLFSFLQEVSRV